MKKLLLSFFVVGGVMQAEGNHNNGVTQETVQAPKPALLQHAIKVNYINWRGETAIRLIVPLEIYFGATEYHTQEQWLLRVWDVERNAERIYAFKDIKEIIG